MKRPEAEPNVSISLSVPLSTYATIKRMSKVQRRPMNDVLRGVLEQWLESEGIEHYRFISDTELLQMRQKIRAELESELQKKMELTLF